MDYLDRLANSKTMAYRKLVDNDHCVNLELLFRVVKNISGGPPMQQSNWCMLWGFGNFAFP
jgi:hypothetical protein